MKNENTENEYPPTPELDKLKKVAPDSQKIGEFLEWLSSEKQFAIAQRDAFSHELFPISIGIEKLLADYFQINLQAVENERRAILDWHRKTTELSK